MNTVLLSVPLKRGEVEITEIQLRRPNGSGELRGLSLLDIQRCEITAILTLTKRLTLTPLTDDEINRIDPVDLVKIANMVVDFFQS